MARIKQTKQAFKFNPFERLKGFLEEEKIQTGRSKGSLKISKGDCASEEAHECDAKVFLEAVSDVRPLSGAEYERRSLPHRQPVGIPSEDEECVRKMKELVKHGRGFIISDTQEYVQGTGYDVPRAFANRLHRGDFSVQGHIDLHGFLSYEAREAFDGFMRQALLKGWRTVLIIHGRGLSSPEEPVIKNKVIEWLQSHRWRKWVIAYSSARSCDGGTGATYVLLRQRPFSGHALKKEI